MPVHVDVGDVIEITIDDTTILARVTTISLKSETVALALVATIEKEIVEDA